MATCLTLAQIALALFIRGESPDAGAWAGWIAIWIGGVFGVVPIVTFRRIGGVARGQCSLVGCPEVRTRGQGSYDVQLVKNSVARRWTAGNPRESEGEVFFVDKPGRSRYQ